MNGCASALNPNFCIACKKSDQFLLFSVVTPYPGHDELYTIYQCRHCGHAMAKGRSDAVYLSQIYAHNFHASDQQAATRKNAPIRANAQLRARKLAGVIQGKLLDVGAGTGAFLSAAQDFFSVQGVEFSPEAAEHARRLGHSMHTGDFLEMDLGEERFDVITFWDVLASLHAPDAALEKCASLLRQDGRVILTLPMIDSTVARIFGKRWPLMIPPVNLHYFTHNSITHLAARAGFTVADICYEGKKVSLQFLATKAVRSFSLNVLEPYIKRFVPRFNITINTGDIAQVTLVKRTEETL